MHRVFIGKNILVNGYRTDKKTPLSPEEKGQITVISLMREISKTTSV